MRQEFLRKKKMHSETDTTPAFELVGVPDVLKE
jgi:hypothetical protein